MIKIHADVWLGGGGKGGGRLKYVFLTDGSVKKKPQDFNPLSNIVNGWGEGEQ